MVLAHFTLTELPGTLAIWLCGAALGAAILSRDLRMLAAPLALIAGMFCAAMLASGAGWSQAAQIAIDLGFAAGALACLWRLVALRDRPRDA